MGRDGKSGEPEGERVLRNRGGSLQRLSAPLLTQHLPVMQCGEESRKERLPFPVEPLATENYRNVRKSPGLSGAALFHRPDRGSRCGRTRIGAVKADQDFIGGVLQPRVGLVQLASGLARQLAELVAIGHVRKCPEY